MSSSQVQDTAAVIPTLTCPDVPIEVWIEVDGKQVPYYSREHDENKKEVTCWIESEAGKSFAIKYNSKPRDYSLRLAVYLDGTITTNIVHHPEYAGITYSISDIQISNEEARSLNFGTLELTDDDAYLKKRSQTEKSFGEIQVVIHRVVAFVRYSDSEPAPYCTFSMPDTTKVHERAKKGLTHLIKQGETKQQAACRSIKSLVLGPLLTTFVFRYRPRAMLQANGVMPPDPTQSSSSTQSEDREVSNQQESEDEVNAAEDEEEERALLARLEEIRKKRQLAEETGTSGNRRKRVKIERVAPTLNFTPGEIIDAADDIRVIVPESKSKKPKIVIDLTL